MLKPLSLLLTLSLVLGLAGLAFDAEAKRLGSGKSFGQSHKTAPAYAPPTSMSIIWMPSKAPPPIRPILRAPRLVGCWGE